MGDGSGLGARDDVRARLRRSQAVPGWIASTVGVLANGLLITAIFPLLHSSLLVALVFAAPDHSLSAKIVAVIVVAMLIGSVLIYLLAPFVLLAPIVVPMAALWRRPMRTLLLRPFNRATSTNYLRRLTRRVLAPLGHTYTLSDQRIRTPWYRRVPLLFGQLQLLSFRFRTLRSERDVSRLSKMISRTFFRNLNWFLSRSQIFPLRARDEVWVRAVEVLVAASDLVIIDVTDRKPNVIHEIEICARLNKRDSVILIVDREQVDETRRFMEEAFGAPEMPILPYSDKATSFEAFTTELALLVGFSESKRRHWKSAIFAIGLAAAMAACSAVWWQLGGVMTTHLAPEAVVSSSSDFEAVLSIHDGAVIEKNSALAATSLARLKKDFRLQLLDRVRAGLAPDRFEHANDLLRAEWLTIIKDIGTDDDHPRLLTLLQYSMSDRFDSSLHFDTHVAIVETMSGLHADPWPYLTSELLTSSFNGWRNVIALVRKFRHRGAVPNLIRCLDDTFKGSEALSTLVELEAREAIPTLLEQVEVKAFPFSGRGPVRDALDALVDQSSVPVLIAALASPNRGPRDYAISALARLHAHQALPALVRLLPTVPQAGEAASAIVDLEDVDVVCRHLHARDDDVREWANEQLARLSRKDRSVECR